LTLVCKINFFSISLSYASHEFASSLSLPFSSLSDLNVLLIRSVFVSVVLTLDLFLSIHYLCSLKASNTCFSICSPGFNSALPAVSKIATIRPMNHVFTLPALSKDSLFSTTLSCRLQKMPVLALCVTMSTPIFTLLHSSSHMSALDHD
jgi:hypothetical protein